MKAAMALSPRITVGGQELAARWLDGLQQARVDRGLGVVGRAVLRFADPGFALADAALFAIGVEVSLAGPGRDGALITGVVTAVELEQYAVGSVPELVVTVDDKAIRLAGGGRSRTFLNQSISQIVAAVCRGAGVTSDIAGATAQHAYVLQDGSDLSFVHDTLQRAGLVWWIDGSGVLHATRPGTSTDQVQAELGTELLSFQVRATAAAPDQVKVSGWDQAQQTSIAASSTAAAHGGKGRRPAFVAGATGRGGNRGWPSEAVVREPAPLDRAEADTLAEAMAADAAAAAVTMKATCWVNPRLAPAVTLRVTGAGPAAGDYLLTHVEHVYHRSGFQTHVTAGPLRPDGLVDLLEPRAGAPGLSGLVPAIVTNATDPERRGQGLVKVKYPAVTGNVESAWARVLSLGGGSRRGVVFQPEVGDEVLVGFEQGDPRRAVVLGGLHSEKAALPHADTVEGDKVKYRRITSRKGHLLEFADGDAPADQHVLMSSRNGEHRIRLGNDRLDLEVGNVPLFIRNGAGASIELTAAGDLVLKGKNVTIESTGGASTLTAATDLTLKGTTALKAQGATVSVKGSASTTVEASGVMAVKGATVAIN